MNSWKQFQRNFGKRIYLKNSEVSQESQLQNAIALLLEAITKRASNMSDEKMRLVYYKSGFIWS